MSKAKKKIVSKFAGSSVGKSVINKAIGSSGKEMMKAVKNILVLNSGKKAAKDTMSNIYKIAAKVNTMYSKKQIDESKIPELTTKTKKLTRTLLSVLNNSDSKEALSKIDVLLKSTKELETILHSLIDKNLTSKNIKMASNLLETLSKREFLNSVITEEKYLEFKNQLYEKLHEVMMYTDKSYALGVNSKISSSAFKSQYGKEIETVQNFWNKLDEDDHDKLSMSIFNRLIEADSAYYNIIPNCIKGDQPEEQHKLLINAIDRTVKGLDDWEKLRDLLREQAGLREKWGPGVPGTVYGQFNSSFHGSMAKCFPSYSENGVIEAFTILMRLVVHVLESN